MKQRPPTMRVTTSFALPIDVLERLEIAAQNRGISKSELIRRTLEEAIPELREPEEKAA